MSLSKQILILAFISILTAPLVLAHDGAKNSSDADKRVRAVLLENASAVERGDLSAIQALWANDDGVTVFEGGYVNRGWVDYRDNHLGPELAEMKNVRYTLDEIRVHLAGATAWATFEYSISGSTAKEGAFSGSGLGTAVLENRRGKWRIVHWHSSSKPRSEP